MFKNRFCESKLISLFTKVLFIRLYYLDGIDTKYDPLTALTTKKLTPDVSDIEMALIGPVQIYLPEVSKSF